MRKPRDFDSELKALDSKARQLKQAKLQQLGELVVATGADVLPVDQLAGALLAIVSASDIIIREDWRQRGAAFFQRERKARGGASSGAVSAAAADGGTAPPRSATGAE
ncbi:Conjugal transfer protein TraD [Sphingomonas sp. NFR04]|uniref:conjugal transfer protein TraD n=1 Tax=Sphingomonas sp. NFR04 TaxID=1566283 RepID=UPI0008E1EACA|nr:conjugal transfer protein TraD [Sphingomonas sp. NFR04]SFJ46213.1 Conjugal transfer protein TraD [Sphingomonas sp. NFR04]